MPEAHHEHPCCLLPLKVLAPECQICSYASVHEARTVDLLLQIALGGRLVNHVFEDGGPFVDAGLHRWWEIIRIGITYVCLLKDRYSRSLGDSGNELLGDSPQQGLKEIC